MYFKKEILRYNKSIDLNNTFKFDELPETGLSAGLILWIKSPIKSGAHYSYALSGDKFRLIDWITKVQVITDGKRPLKDLDGSICHALNYWNSGRTAVDQFADRTLYGDYAVVPIAWGQRLYDPNYFLRWEDYGSIELDVTNIFSTSLFDSATITIENIKIEDAPAGLSSKGVFQERIWREWATVQNEWKYLKPPVGNKYRRIILQAIPAQATSFPYRRNTNFWDLMEEIKLAFKDYTEVAFDGYGRELMEQNALEFPHEAHVGGTLLASGAASGSVDVIRTGIGRRRSAQATKAEVATSLTEMNFGIYTYLDDLMTVLYDVGTNQYVYYDVWGLGYENTLALLFDHLGAENYIDSNAKATINLDIKTRDLAAAAGGTNKVVLCEQVAK